MGRRTKSTSKEKVGVTKVNAKGIATLKKKRKTGRRGLQKIKTPRMMIRRKQDVGNTEIERRGRDAVDAKIERTSKTNEDNADHQMTTPVLQRTISFADPEGSLFRVRDFVAMTPKILVVVSFGGLVRAINPQIDNYLLSELKLPYWPTESVMTLWPYVSKFDDNTVIVFSWSRRVDFVKVMPKLKITKTLELEHDYRRLLALDKNFFVGVRKHRFDTSFDILNTSGKILRTFQPKILNCLNLPRPEHLLVNRQQQIAVVDSFLNMIISVSLFGKIDFIYSGCFNNEYDVDKFIKMDRKEFQKTNFTLRKPSSVASDSKGNFYIADKRTGIVVKVDANGTFVQNILPLNVKDFSTYHMAIHIDENNTLYYSDNKDPPSSIKVYKLV